MSAGVPVELVPTRCAVCGTEDDAEEVYRANLEASALNPVVFSARRLPDGLHFRIVTCNRCGLLRSDPIVRPEFLARLYADSTFDETESDNLRRTYGRYLGELDRHRARKHALLEIGCGTGFFLEEARARGYVRAVGVEPSVAAVRKARARDGIDVLCDVIRPGLFPPRSFDVICMFQTLDHLPDPGAALDECRSLLRPGGLLLALNHDSGALSARLLGERSPIVDIEHTYFYDAITMRRLFVAHGFRVLRVGPAVNCYSFRYLLSLLPLAPRLRSAVLKAVDASPLARWRLWAPLGNLRLVAERPAQ